MSVSILRPDTLPLASIQGTLALDGTADQAPPRLVPVPGRPGGDVVPVDRKVRRQLEQWCHRYAQAVVEIVSGDRPVTQVLRWTTPDVYATLARRAQLVARAGGHRPGEGRQGPAVRAQVLGVRTCFVSPERVEASVHVRYGERSRAIAACFELIGGRWQCSALEFA
ncbi:MAG: Rv3235 family protein [Nocardioides sp.]|uniref:Rv3235 family protein n=1 Tax=Nocardioides sp. TaxID=35761 RepID=UPI0039E45C03